MEQRGIQRARPFIFNFFLFFPEKEAERIRERLAQEEAEAMEMEDEENKLDHMLDKGVKYI